MQNNFSENICAIIFEILSPQYYDFPKFVSNLANRLADQNDKVVLMTCDT